jgi:large subunit ribosomal protein L16
MQQEQQDMEQNNQNPWTFQRIARGNMLGVRRVLSPFDLHNHGKHSGKFHNPGRV